MLNERLYEYIQDVENPETNYNLGLEYKKIGQTGAALSFFLRAADRSGDDLDLAYECLIHLGECFDAQQNRNTHVCACYKHAIALLPHRPEAYYHICRIKNWTSLYDEAYYFSSIALNLCNFDHTPLKDIHHYKGKYSLLFEKALSSWHWGKIEECRTSFLDLCKNHWNDLNEYEKGITQKYLKDHYNIDVEKILLESVDRIPVIGVPIVNGFHWIKRLVESIDYPVGHLIIINNNGRGELTDELDILAKTKYKFIDKISVTHLPANIGCAGAWNLIIKSCINSPSWIIVNNDIAFSPGMLEEMHREAVTTDSGMVHAKKSDWGGGAYDAFLIKDWVVQKCGLFDENLYPAYAEDVDYYIRVKNEGIKISILNIDYLHGDKDYETTGAQTWRLDVSLKEKIDNSRILNENEYLNKKWGNEYQTLQTYNYPFDNQSLDSSYTRYDLNFVRKKYLGF